MLIDLHSSTSVFHWEYVGHSFTLEAPHEAWPTIKLLQLLDLPETTLPVEPVTAEEEPNSLNSFQWQPPDLLTGSEWYQQRITNLHNAVACYPTSQQVVMLAEGERALSRH